MYVKVLIHLMLNETVDSFQHAEILLGRYKLTDSLQSEKLCRKFPK